MKLPILLIAVCIFTFVATSVAAQISVSISKTPGQPAGGYVLHANVQGGSGKYLYAWGILSAGSVPQNSSTSSLDVSAQSSTYSVFVKDEVSGEIAMATVDINSDTIFEGRTVRSQRRPIKNGFTSKGTVPPPPTDRPIGSGTQTLRFRAAF